MTSFRSIAARSSIRPRRRARCGLGHRRTADRQPESRSISRSRRPTTGSMSMCAGSGPLPAAMIAKLSRVAEQHRLARLTRHGELVLMRKPPTITIGTAQRHPAAGLVPAGHRRRRGDAGGAGRRALPARQTHRRPVLRGRAVCVAAGGEGADRGVRQRCRRGEGLAEGGDGDFGVEAGRKPRHATCSGVR